MAPLEFRLNSTKISAILPGFRKADMQTFLFSDSVNILWREKKIK